MRRGGSKLQCALLLTTNKVERNRVVLFKCDWYDLSREGIGYKRDWHGTTIVNTLRKLKTKEPFVLACQATQFYYVNGKKISHGML